MPRAETVTVLAGGWSARAYLDRLPGTIIGVNDAAVFSPCDIAVSMDRLWTEHRFPHLAEIARPAWLRRSALQNIPRPLPDWVRPFACDNESTTFAEDPQHEELNGTHSGFCALNLAYQMRPQRLVLVGFDMGKGPDGEAHWWPDYPWAKPGGATTAGKFAQWAGQFAGAAAQFKAVGVGVEVWGATAIPCFGRTQ